MVVIVIFIMAITLLNFFLVATFRGSSPPVGGATSQSTQGEVGLCINKAPSITAIADQTATASTAFSLQVEATDESTTMFSYIDNTSLFAISNTGLISFTPSSSDVGTHSILITVQDNQSCSNLNATDDFILTINASTTDGSGGGSGSSGSGGSGGGGGGAAASTGGETGVVEKEITYSSSDTSFDVQEGNSVTFTFGTKHSIDVQSVDETGATVLVSSTPQLITFQVGDTKEIDVDEDGIADISLKLKSVSGTAVSFRLAYLRDGFTVSEELVKAHVRQSQSLQKIVSLKSDWGGDLTITTKAEPSWLQISPEELTLPKGGSGELQFLLNPSSASLVSPEFPVSPGVYSNEVTILGDDTYDSFAQKVLVILEVISEELLFDLSLDVQTKTLLPTDSLQATITILNTRQTPLNNLLLVYNLQDTTNSAVDSKIIWEERETISLQEQASFTRTFALPAGIAAGKYVFALKASSEGMVGTASELITIQEAGEVSSALAGLAFASGIQKITIIALPIFFVVVILLFVFLFVHHHRSRKEKTIVHEQKTIDHQTALRRKLGLLEDSYRQGYIQKETYLQSKSKIEQLLRK